MHKTPAVMAALLPDVLWKVSTTNKEIFLTFDDGPVPEATPWVLDQLEKYNALATFFMVGENVHKYPNVYADVIKRGHSIGNHTYNHLSGWKSGNKYFYSNIDKAREVLMPSTTKLFRPPHGRLKWSQYRKLRADYQIIMWDVLSGDFSTGLPAEKCLAKSVAATEPGSIIVFHDSVKSIAKLKSVLPQYLDHFSNRGFTFKSL